MTFPAVIKCSDESDLQEKGLILTHSSSTTHLGGEDCSVMMLISLAALYSYLLVLS